MLPQKSTPGSRAPSSTKSGSNYLCSNKHFCGGLQSKEHVAAGVDLSTFYLLSWRACFGLFPLCDQQRARNRSIEQFGRCFRPDLSTVGAARNTYRQAFGKHLRRSGNILTECNLRLARLQHDSARGPYLAKRLPVKNSWASFANYGRERATAYQYTASATAAPSNSAATGDDQRGARPTAPTWRRLDGAGACAVHHAWHQYAVQYRELRGQPFPRARREIF